MAFFAQKFYRKIVLFENQPTEIPIGFLLSLKEVISMLLRKHMILEFVVRFMHQSFTQYVIANTLNGSLNLSDNM